MSLDAFKNIAITTLAAGITSGATSLTVATGTGTKFPAVSFNAFIWNSTDYAAADLDPNYEIVRVTAIATDTFTITRAQEGTTGVAHNTGGKTYSIAAGVTALTMNNLVGKDGGTFSGTITFQKGEAGGIRLVTTTANQLDTDGFVSFTGAPYTFSLLAASTLVAGRRFYFANNTGTGSITLAVNGSDDILSAAGVFNSGSPLTLGAGARIGLEPDGVSRWYRFL